jgi:PAS domain S-box-containing protein
MKKTLVKVLLIEDNPADALLLRESLRGDLLADFQVTVAEWLRQGLAKLDTEEFDVLLLDLGLPDSQGLETFEEAHWAHPEIPVVVLSGMSDELLALQAVQSGAQDYLVKGEAGWSLGPHAIRYAIERKRADEKLHRVEQRFRALIEKTAEMIMVISADGIIQYASPSSERIMGYKPEEALGLSFLDWVHPGDRSIALESLVSRSRIPGTAPANLIVRGHHKDGTWRYIEALGTNLLADPAVQGIVLNMRDVTERAQAEERLRKLSRAVEQSPTSIIITDLQGSIEYVNPRFSEVTGYSLREALGLNPRILKSGHTSDGEYKKLWGAITSGQVWQGEFLNKKKNGEIYWESATIAPVFGEDGRITNFLAVKENITEQKQAEDRLKLRESYLTAIIENQPGLVWLKDKDSRFLTVNTAFALSCGRITPEEVTGRTDLDVWPVELAQRYRSDDAQIMSEEKSSSFEERIFDCGQVKWFETFKTPVFDEAGSVIGTAGYAHDITERKQAEQALRESEEHLRLAHDAAELGTWKEDLVIHVFTMDERARRHYD